MSSSCPASPECPTDRNSCVIPAFTMDCETGLIDLKVDDCTVTSDCQISSQVIMALYVKGRDENVVDACKGGWWGDPQLGSRLWTLEGNNAANSVLTVEQYVEAALAPIQGLGIIDSVTVNASQSGDTITIDDLLISQPDAQNDYSYLWEAGCELS